MAMPSATSNLQAAALTLERRRRNRRPRRALLGMAPGGEWYAITNYGVAILATSAERAALHLGAARLAVELVLDGEPLEEVE